MEKFNAEAGDKKEIAKEKILEFMAASANASASRGVNNDEIQKLLGVSDATATNYLSELEKENKIQQIGEEGRGVYYKLK